MPLGELSQDKLGHDHIVLMTKSLAAFLQTELCPCSRRVRTVDGPCQVTVAYMAAAVVAVKRCQQKGGIPRDKASKPQEDDAGWPAQVGKGKGQGCIRCTKQQAPMSQSVACSITYCMLF